MQDLQLYQRKMFWNDNNDLSYIIDFGSPYTGRYGRSGFYLDSESIISESVEITQSVCEDSEMTLGGCIASSCTFEAIDNTHLMTNKSFTAYICVNETDVEFDNDNKNLLNVSENLTDLTSNGVNIHPEYGLYGELLSLTIDGTVSEGDGVAYDLTNSNFTLSDACYIEIEGDQTDVSANCNLVIETTSNEYVKTFNGGNASIPGNSTITSIVLNINEGTYNQLKIYPQLRTELELGYQPYYASSLTLETFKTWDFRLSMGLFLVYSEKYKTNLKETKTIVAYDKFTEWAKKTITLEDLRWLWRTFYITGNPTLRTIQEYFLEDKLLQTGYSLVGNDNEGRSFIQINMFERTGVSEDSITGSSVFPVGQYTYLQLFQRICETKGCWGYIDRDGNYAEKYPKVKTINGSLSHAITESEKILMSNNDNTDYPEISAIGNVLTTDRIHIGTLEIQKDSEMQWQYIPDSDAEVKYILDNNPFLTNYQSTAYPYGEALYSVGAWTENGVAKSIYSADYNYMPSKLELQGLPYMDAGDWYAIYDDESGSMVEQYQSFIAKRTLKGVEGLIDKWESTGLSDLSTSYSGGTGSSSSYNSSGGSAGTCQYAYSAGKATCDGDGNIITETYLTEDDVPDEVIRGYYNSSDNLMYGSFDYETGAFSDVYTGDTNTVYLAYAPYYKNAGLDAYDLLEGGDSFQILVTDDSVSGETVTELLPDGTTAELTIPTNTPVRWTYDIELGVASGVNNHYVLGINYNTTYGYGCVNIMPVSESTGDAIRFSEGDGRTYSYTKSGKVTINGTERVILPVTRSDIEFYQAFDYGAACILVDWPSDYTDIELNIITTKTDSIYYYTDYEYPYLVDTNLNPEEGYVNTASELYLYQQATGKWALDKAKLDNYYTKYETSNLLAEKLDVTALASALSNYYTSEEVDNIVDALKNGLFVAVNSLPTASADTLNKIYLVPKEDTENNDIKDEYITLEVSEGVYAWELIGSTQIDLSGYVKTIKVGETTYSVDANTTNITLPTYESGAEVNVQSDWNVSDSTSDAYIKNKPTTIEGYGITDAKIDDGVITLGSDSITPVVDDDYVHTDNNFTDSYESSIDGLVENKEVLGAKNLTNIDGFTTWRMTRNDLSFTNTVVDSGVLNLYAYCYSGNTYLSGQRLENTLGVHNIEITIPATTTVIVIRHQGADKDLQIGIPWTKAGAYRLCYNIISVDTSTIGGFEIADIMIMLPSENNTTYEGYAMGNIELTQRILNLPTVNNATLTIQKNGTTVNTFTANSSTDKVVNISVPTKTSDITNDSGYLSSNSKMSVSGNPVEVSNNSKYVDSGTISFSPSQELNGYDKPWIGGGGKNLFNFDAWKSVEVYHGTSSVSGNSITLTATSHDCYTKTGAEETKIYVSEGETITLSWSINDTAIDAYVYLFPNDTTRGMKYAYARTGEIHYTVGSGVTYITFRVGVTNAGDSLTYSNIQIEKGSTATSYAPYENICPITGYDELKLNLYANSTDSTPTKEFTFDLGGTKYGGTLNFVTGVLTLEREYKNIEDMTLYDRGENISTPAIGAVATLGSAMCTAYPQVAPVSSVADLTTDYSFAVVESTDNENGTIVFRDTRYTDAESFKTALTGQAICYTLNNPRTIQLIPHLIELIANYNYITTDGDTISLDYWLDDIVGELADEGNNKLPVTGGNVMGDVTFNKKDVYEEGSSRNGYVRIYDNKISANDSDGSMTATLAYNLLQIRASSSGRIRFSRSSIIRTLYNGDDPNVSYTYYYPPNSGYFAMTNDFTGTLLYDNTLTSSITLSESIDNFSTVRIVALDSNGTIVASTDAPTSLFNSSTATPMACGNTTIGTVSFKTETTSATATGDSTYSIKIYGLGRV